MNKTEATLHTDTNNIVRFEVFIAMNFSSGPLGWDDA